MNELFDRITQLGQLLPEPEDIEDIDDIDSDILVMVAAEMVKTSAAVCALLGRKQ